MANFSQKNPEIGRIQRDFSGECMFIRVEMSKIYQDL